VCATTDGRFLYAVNWQTAEAAKSDTVSAYAIDKQTGALTLLNRASAGGGLPNQVIVDPQAKFVMVTNYGFHGNDSSHNNSSLAALPIQTDGRLGAPFYVDHHTGAALSPRQITGAHTHGVVFTKDDRLAFVAELGLDRVYVYHVDATKTAVTAADPPFVSLSAGSGPRRLALSPNEKFLYVNHETDSKISVFAIDRGTLQEIQQISTLPADFTGRNSTAEIQMDKAGRFLYVSNRGANSIAVYAVDASKGTLTLQGFAPALGKSPRNITIDPTGHYFFAANQSSNNVVIFSVDAKSGQLTPTGQQLQMDQPASVFLVKSE
jgi:6-phosphogluconolactonase